jgi:hypothetical protein
MQPLAILQTARLPSVHNREKPDGANQPTSDAQSKRLLTAVEPVQNTARSQLAGTAGALHIKTGRPRPFGPRAFTFSQYWNQEFTPAAQR